MTTFNKLIKTEWVGILVVTSMTVQAIKNETLAYSIASAFTASLMGLVISTPFLFLIKFIFKIHLKWYYWFNCSTMLGFILAIFLATRVVHPN